MLVADDSRAVQLFFKDIADRSHMSIELVTASTGTECIDLLSKGVINLAFINVNMPQIRGRGGVGRAGPFGDKTLVVLMSAKFPEPRLELARQLDVYEYLVKPFTAVD